MGGGRARVLSLLSGAAYPLAIRGGKNSRGRSSYLVNMLRQEWGRMFQIQVMHQGLEGIKGGNTGSNGWRVKGKEVSRLLQ